MRIIYFSVNSLTWAHKKRIFNIHRGIRRKGPALAAHRDISHAILHPNLDPGRDSMIGVSNSCALTEEKTISGDRERGNGLYGISGSNTTRAQYMRSNRKGRAFLHKSHEQKPLNDRQQWGH